MTDDEIGNIEVRGLAELDRKLAALDNEVAGKALFGAAMFALTPMVSDAKKRAAKAAEPHKMTMVNGRTVTVEPGLLKSAIRKRRLPKKEHKGEFAQGAVVGIYVGKGTKQKIYPRYWHFIERGTVSQPAAPFLRPAFDAKTGEVVQRFATKLAANIDRLTE